ncbi:MAG: hypothetical protein LBI05_10835 [Planctomycetaceae bacterium]|jgi:hypothetical protein|nr:hypothetical protein [Planctomycetaceae bacterium]
MSRLILFIAAVLFCASLYAAAPSADILFPDSTKGFVSIRNLKEFGEQWKSTQFGQLLDDPLMAEFKKEIEKQITERMETTFGLTFDGIASLPSGEIAFGMIAIPQKTPGFVLTMDVTGKRTETDRYLANLMQKFVAAGVKKSTATYKDNPVTHLVFPAPEAPPVVGNMTVEAIERNVYYTFVQDVFIASDQLHMLHLIADRVADLSGVSLSEREGYQVTMKRCISDLPAGILPSLRWYIEPLDYGEAVRAMLRGPVAQKRRDKPSVFTILKQQGFDALRGIGGVVSVKSEKQETVYRTLIYTKKPFERAMRMFNFPDQANFVPPTWMPSDVARCTILYVDPLAIFENIGPLFDAFVMPGEEGVWQDIMDGLEKDPHGPKINLRKELIDHLGNRILGMSRYEKPITTKSESVVIAVELKDGKESNMLAGMEKLFGTDQEMAFVMHNSYKIWHRKPVGEIIQPDDFEIPTIFGDSNDIGVSPQSTDDADRAPTFPEGGVTVAKNCLFVSTNREYLKLILDRLDAPAEAAKSTVGNENEYKEVDRIFGNLGLTNKPHFFQFFARTHETLRPTYEMIRQGQMTQSEAILAKLLNEMLVSDAEQGTRRQILDGATMPEFDKVQHYFGTVGIYGVSEENGFFIKGFSLERDAK